MDVEKNNSPDKSERYGSENSIKSDGFFRSQRYKLQPRRYFGISHKTNKDLQFFNDSTVLHLCGRIIILNNLVEKSQRFLKLKEVESEVDMVVLSRNRKFVAISERTVDGPVISVYSMDHNKHIQTYMPPTNAESIMIFNCIAYTCDSAYLVAIVPQPEWKIVFYSTKTGKIHSVISKLGKRSVTSTVLQIICHPSDPKQLIALGYDYFQLMKFKSPRWVNYGYEGDLSVKITGACWITAAINILGTSDGRLIFIEHGHVQGVYDASDTVEVDLTLEEVDNSIFTTLSDDEKSLAYKRVYKNEVKALVGFENGFAFSCKIGEVIVFEASDELDYKLRWYKKVVYLVITPTDDKLIDSSLMSAIQQICISPNKQIIACTTMQQEIYYSNMNSDFPQKQINYVYFKKLFGDVHYGPVGSISVARWKPFYITSGVLDHSIILWNYNLNVNVFRMEFPEEICSVSLHPTGLFCLVGFSERIRLAAIYQMGIKFVREISVRSCTSVVFSQGGHLFAAVCGKKIYTYSAVTFSCNYIFRGHAGPINCVHFSSNDYYIYSAGMEGSIYKWDVSDGTRECDYFTRDNANMDVDFIEEENLVYMVGTDGCLRELVRGNYFYQLSRTFDLHLGSMYSVKIVNSGETIVVAGEEGVLLAIGRPIFSPIKFRQYTIHTTPVRRMLIPPDENILMSVSDDGSVCLWDLIPPESAKSTIQSTSSQSVLSLDRKESKYTSGSQDIPLDEPLEKYTSYVIVDMEEWIQGFDFMEEFSSRLIETDKANEFALLQTKATFEKLIKQLDSEHAQNVANLEMQMNTSKRDAIMKWYECRGKLEGMSLNGDNFDFTMKRYNSEVRSLQIIEKCRENVNKFHVRIRKALKEFSTCKTKTLVCAIDRHQQLEYKVSKASANCNSDLLELENTRDEDEYSLRKEIQEVFTSLHEGNLKMESHNILMVTDAETHSDRLFSNFEIMIHWIRAFQANKQVGLELQKETNRLHVERESLDKELHRLSLIKKYALFIKSSYLNRAYVLNKLVADVRTVLEPLYAICRNRMLKCDRLLERFNTKNNILRNIILKYMKSKFVHNTVRKAMIRSWKSSSSIAKVFTNLENETHVRATFGYSPKALKAILKLISKVYDKKVRKPAYDQKLKQLAEIKRHRKFLKMIINMNNMPPIGYVMTKYIYRHDPSDEQQEDILNLYRYTNHYQVRTKSLLHKLKSFRNATHFNAPGKTCEEKQIEHANNVLKEKLRVKLCLSRRKERTKNYNFATILLDGEIYRWRKAMESRSARLTRKCKNEMILSRWNSSQISRHSMTPADQSCIMPD